MLSVREGFDANIPPEYMKHPANCKLMIHSENISKHRKSTISFEELLERIAGWNAKHTK